jgi:starch phosphorylase
MTTKNDAAASGTEQRDTPTIVVEDDRTGMSPETLERAVFDHLYYTCSKNELTATPHDVFRAVVHATRDRLVHRWIKTQSTYYAADAKRVYYLSAEFLLGRSLGLNLINLGQYETARRMLRRHGFDLDRLVDQEPDPGLGNGGLGRLAACFLDSMATLGLPGYGYGIRYEFGIFEQRFRDGWQVEHPDAWIRFGNDWEVPRHEHTVTVCFGGRQVESRGPDGRLRVSWVDTHRVLAVPYDMPVAGYANDTVNNLRLWSARATHEFDLTVFNDGDYRRAVEEKALSESISKVLYPKDETPAGRELRLKQQYFFVCASIADIVRRYEKTHAGYEDLPRKVAIQLNDTHPSIAVAELMRVLIDEKGLEWEPAWEITRAACAYTNHTLLPEALERWPVSLFERLLPRHMSIIYEINHRFLRQVHVKWPQDDERKRRMSIIEEGADRMVRMAHLAVVGSHSVNGVAALHTDLIKSQLMPDFFALWPERFNNKTNGVTPRRWILSANPRLAAAITRRIGRGWITDLDELRRLEPLANDPELHAELREAKLENKRRLAKLVAARHWFEPDLESIFDVQVKRLHEYKRQLLSCLHIVSFYAALKRDPGLDVPARTFVFGGKAAPGYKAAKLHIKLINDVAELVNHDAEVSRKLRVVFLENYSVSLAERIIPAADVSEQISLAGMEASGTGNMKLMMNGALTVGTLDGANVEIRAAVGDESFFLCGMTADEVRELRRAGYEPWRFIERSPALAEALELIESGVFSPDDRGRFRSVVDALRHDDRYMICADFESCRACQAAVGEAWQDHDGWSRRVVMNLARSGVFSSDRTIRQYAEGIWGVEPVKVVIEASARSPVPE